MDEEGIRTDLLEAKLKELADQGESLFIYVIALTSTTLQALPCPCQGACVSELARQYNIPVVEMIRISIPLEGEE